MNILETFKKQSKNIASLMLIINIAQAGLTESLLY
jgi:hypothetical protein